MLKQMKPGRNYFIIKIDEPYAWKVFDVLKAGQIKKGEWPEGDITFEEWIDKTFSKAPSHTDVIVKIIADTSALDASLAKIQKAIAGVESVYCEDCRYWFGPGGYFTPPCTKANGHISTYRSKKPTYLIPEIANKHNDCGSYEKKKLIEVNPAEVKPARNKGWRGLLFGRFPIGGRSASGQRKEG
ncbi:MAG: hypothetical protein WC891_02890 [Actinomycetota bacterium]